MTYYIYIYIYIYIDIYLYYYYCYYYVIYAYIIGPRGQRPARRQGLERQLPRRERGLRVPRRPGDLLAQLAPYLCIYIYTHVYVCMYIYIYIYL